MNPTSVTYLAGFICSLLSVIGSLFTILTYIWIKETRKNFYFFLVFHLAIADLGIAMTGLDPFPVGSDFNGIVCDIFGMFRTFFVMGTFILNFMIALTIYMSVIKKISGDFLMKKRNSFLIPNYVICILAAAGPELTQSYGPEEIFCWISVGNNSITAKFWVILFGYVMFPIVCVGILVFYALSIKVLRKRNKNEGSFYELFLLPIFFILCNVLTLVNRFYANNFVLTFVHITLRQSQGWIDAIIYAFGVIKQEIKNKWTNLKIKRLLEEPEL